MSIRLSLHTAATHLQRVWTSKSMSLFPYFGSIYDIHSAWGYKEHAPLCTVTHIASYKLLHTSPSACATRMLLRVFQSTSPLLTVNDKQSCWQRQCYKFITYIEETGRPEGLLQEVSAGITFLFQDIPSTKTADRTWRLDVDIISHLRTPHVLHCPQSMS